MLNGQIIYIIGFMGSGKTTTGKKLASLLGWSFIDLDWKIEEFTGKSITEIFSQSGEEYFRIIESEILRELKSETNTVISTGGGTPCYGNNMDFMLETGLTLYLRLTPAELKSRLSATDGERPLLRKIDNTDLQSFIENKLASREKYYTRAEIHFNGFDIDYTSLCSLVRKTLSSEN